MIKESLTKKADEIEVTDNLFNQIKLNIYEKEQETMRKNKFSLRNSKKTFGIALACMALISGTLIAGTVGKSWIGRSTLRYSNFPKQATVQKDIGFLPKYVESLPGDFDFYMGHVGDNALVDDVNRPIVETKSLSLGYKQEETGKKVNLSAEKLPEQYMMLGEGTELVETYKDAPLYYYEMMYKFVPESYELTEEDQAALESGELEISVGSDEVSIEKVQSINWNEGDIRYSVMGMGVDLPVEELVAMAKTVIDSE